jgi:hypothetical protein
MQITSTNEELSGKTQKTTRCDYNNAYAEKIDRLTNLQRVLGG